MKAHHKSSLATRIALSLALCVSSLPSPGAFAAADESTLNSIEVERLILEGQNYYQKGHYKEALHSFEQAKSMGTSSDYQEAVLALGLADALRLVGRYKEAEELFKSSIAKAEETDKEHLNKKYKANRKRSSDLVPTMMSDLSILYLEQSRFPECEQVLKQSLEHRHQEVGPNNPKSALPLGTVWSGSTY